MIGTLEILQFMSTFSYYTKLSFLTGKFTLHVAVFIDFNLDHFYANKL